jgi:hypothetical protein
MLSYFQIPSLGNSAQPGRERQNPPVWTSHVITTGCTGSKPASSASMQLLHFKLDRIVVVQLVIMPAHSEFGTMTKFGSCSRTKLRAKDP